MIAAAKTMGKNNKSVMYPWTKNGVKENDLVWVYDGQRLVRVVKVVETEQEIRLCGVDDVGYFFSHEVSENHSGRIDCFMPQREMKRDMNYLATDIETWGVRLLMHRLTTKYDLKEEKMRYAISYRVRTDEMDEWLTWDIEIWTGNNKTRQFLYDEKGDVFQEINL